jgi:hypothetical protein
MQIDIRALELLPADAVSGLRLCTMSCAPPTCDQTCTNTCDNTCLNTCYGTSTS